MATTYLTTDELSARIKYDSRTIRERMLDSVLIEGTHYIRPFGGRKILFLWEKIEADMALASNGSAFSGHFLSGTSDSSFDIPMASGSACKVSMIQKGERTHKANQGAKHGHH